MARDFNDDKKDAGETWAPGHTVIANLRDRPRRPRPTRLVDPEVPEGRASHLSPSNDLFTVKIRYKPPQGDVSRLIAFPINDDGVDSSPTDDFRFASAVAEFGLLLRDSPFKDKSNT